MIGDLYQQMHAKLLQCVDEFRELDVYVHGSFVDITDTQSACPNNDVDLLIICDPLSRSLLDLLIARLGSIQLDGAALAIEQRVGPLVVDAIDPQPPATVQVTIYTPAGYAGLSPAVRYLHTAGSVPVIGAKLPSPLLPDDWRLQIKRDAVHLGRQWHEEEVAWWRWHGEHELQPLWAQSPLASPQQRSKFQRHSHALLAAWYLLMLESSCDLDGIDDRIGSLLPQVSERVAWPVARRAMLAALPGFE